MPVRSHKIPDQEDLEKELSEYLSKKYNAQIKVISPVMAPQADMSDTAETPPAGVEGIKFDMKPTELEAYLAQYVVKQDEAKAILATKICTHYNRIRYQKRTSRKQNARQTVGRIKNNIILIGPTGVGKTYLVKLIAQKLGVPFVKGDATKFSETGYVGGDVEDLVRELVVQANEDLELAQHGIIYIDEIDKIASSTHLIGPDVSRTGVQRALLKPMEETEVDLKVPHDPISQLQAIEHYRKTGKREKRVVNTKNILFIMSGAFNELTAIIKHRMQKQGIGFGADLHSRELDPRLLANCKAEDLIAYGFESEFIGRLPVIAVLHPLEVEDLYEILKNPNNPIILGKKEDFRSYGIDIKFDDEALHLLAEMAYAEKTGARGLVSVIEKVLLPFEKRLPSSTVQFLVVTSDLVRNPVEELARILDDPNDPSRKQIYADILREEKKRIQDDISTTRQYYLENYPLIFDPARTDIAINYHLQSGQELIGVFDGLVSLHDQITAFENDFFVKHGYQIRFNEEAVNEILKEALTRDISATAVCNEISRDYDYGFKLISDRSGQIQFTLNKNAVLHPDIYLEELIRESYRHPPARPSELNLKS